MDAVIAAKAAATAVKNKDSIGRIIACTAAAVLAPAAILTVCLLEIVSAFMPDGAVGGAGSYNAYESAVCRSIQEAAEPYYERLAAQMEDEKERIEDEHTVEETAVNEAGKTITYRRSTADVTIKMDRISEGVMIACLLLTGGIDAETAAVNQAEAEKFLDSVCSISVTAENENEFTVSSVFLTEEEIAGLYFPEEADREKFLLYCTVYGEYFEAYGGGIHTGDAGESDLAVPLYLQYQMPWGSKPYGNGTIGRNGCCPTCIAMVFSCLKGQNIYPDDITGWSGNAYYVDGEGTSWNIFEAAARQWSLRCTNIGKEPDLMAGALGSGKPVIASMGPGTFTKGGHFIVLSGITESGRIRVRDPNDSSTKRHSEREFEASLILRECKGMWVFEQEGE